MERVEIQKGGLGYEIAGLELAKSGRGVDNTSNSCRIRNVRPPQVSPVFQDAGAS